MKKVLLFMLPIIVFLASCGKGLLQDKTSKDMNYHQSLSFIMKNQKKESPELYKACEQILPLAVENGFLEDYGKVIRIYKNNPDTFSKALTLAGLADPKTDDSVLKDSVFSAVKLARQLSLEGAFSRDAESYYADRHFSEQELQERLNSLRAYISDTYAFLMLERGRPSEALKIYESVIEEYRDTEILLNYAKVLNRLNRYEQSLIASIEALKLTPGSLEAKNTVTETATLLGYSKAEINTMIEETVFVGRNLLRQNLLADELNIPMPAFRLKGIDGSRISSEQFEAKILVVSFFATWCPPCRKELPYMNDLYLKYQNDPEVDIIVVSTDEDKFLVPPFVQDYGFRFPVYYADGLNDDFEVKGIPTLFVIDKNGIIRYKKVGYSEGEEFEKIMDWYIDEIKAAEEV